MAVPRGPRPRSWRKVLRVQRRRKRRKIKLRRLGLLSEGLGLRGVKGSYRFMFKASSLPFG